MMHKLLLLLVLLSTVSCADMNIPPDQTVQATWGQVHIKGPLGDESYFIYRLPKTGKCYMGIYNVGLIEVPSEECGR